MSAKDLLNELAAASANTSEGVWQVKAEQGNREYSPNYGVHADWRTVVHAKSDWEGFGHGSSLRDATFIVQAHRNMPKLVGTLEKLLEFHRDSGEVVHEWTNTTGGSIEPSLRHDAKNYCEGCGHETEWPCPTVTIIEEGLK